MKLTNYIRDAYVTSVMNDVPQKDFSEEAKKVFTKAYLEALPKEIQTAWALPACQGFINTRYANACGQSFNLPADGRSWGGIKTPEKAKAKVDALQEQHNAQEKHRDALRAKVKGAAYACNTTKQLRELLPEFDKYLPAEEEKTLRTLPVVQNIVADFVKAGWPAGAKKGGAK
jgi:hypothetical protein